MTPLSEPDPIPQPSGHWSASERPIARAQADQQLPPVISMAEVRTRRPEPEPSGFTLLDPRQWTQPAPDREWIVPDWIPRGLVTALYGDGGVGKSLASMQLMSSVAL